MVLIKDNISVDRAGLCGAGLAIIMTCHNRRDVTLSCLRALFVCGLPEEFYPRVYLVDDGSTDGTADAVAAEFPDVIIIKGDGSLFWNGGMRLAFSTALEKGYDFYLWLNDDTTLYPDAITLLLKCDSDYEAKTGRHALIVGSTSNSLKDLTTYGGLVRASGWQRTRFVRLPMKDEAQPCDTINGNCVLVPAQIATELGTLESAYAHGMGDIDYGLRAKQRGFELLVAPGYVGVCDHNSIKGSFHDSSLPFLVRMKTMLSFKGLPLKTWFTFTRRHAGVFWPLYFVWPYCRVAISSLFNKSTKNNEGMR